MKGFFRTIKFYTLIAIGFFMYDQGVFASIGDFAHEFRPKTAIAPVSDFGGLDGTRIDLFGFEWQAKDFVDNERYLLETSRMFFEAGYATHGLGALCSTRNGKWLYGGHEECMGLTPQNRLDTYNKARAKEKAAFENAQCHRKKGIKFTPWSKEKRREKCRERVLKRLYG